MNKFDELIAGDTPVLIDFFATWCGPCKAMHPVLEQLKARMGDRVRIVKVDIDSPANKPLTANYKVASVPTLMVFRQGKLLWRQSGALPVAELEKVLNGL